MIAVMVAGLFLNASLTRAFSDAAWVFVIGLLVIQIGRTAWMLTTHLDPINHDHFRRTLVWLAATAPLWIAGAALGAHARLAVWAAAAAIDLAGTWLLAHPVPRRRLRSERLEFGGEHLMERCRLFLLIALGETVVTPGTGLANAPIRATSLLSGASAIAGTLCLWWLYFRAEPIALKHVSHAEDRVYASQMAGNGLLVMIAGLIALAAGNALVIDHPTRESTLALALLLFGGPALFLPQAWYFGLIFGTTLRSHLIAIAALAAVTGAALPAPALVTAVAVVIVLSALVAVEQVKINPARTGRRHRRNGDASARIPTNALSNVRNLVLRSRTALRRHGQRGAPSQRA